LGCVLDVDGALSVARQSTWVAWVRFKL